MGALDLTSTVIHSPLLTAHVRRAPAIPAIPKAQDATPLDPLTRPRYASFEGVDEGAAGVLPPVAVAPELHFPVAEHLLAPPTPTLRRLPIPPLSLAEIKGMLTFYARAHLAHELTGRTLAGRAEEDLLQRKRMVTAGNPAKLIKSLV